MKPPRTLPVNHASERKLTALVDALKALIGHPRFEESFAAFVRGMKERLGVEKAGLLQFDPARGAFGLFPGLRSDFDEGETRRLFARVAHNIETFLEAPETAPSGLSAAQVFRFREGKVDKAVYLLPLRLRGEFAGALLFSKRYTCEEVFFDDHAFLAAIGDQVAAFLERARLFVQVDADRRRMEFLYTLGRDMSGMLEPVEVVRCVAARVLAEFPFPVCALLVHDEAEGFRFHLRSRRQLSARREAEILRDLKENLKGYLDPSRANDLRETRKDAMVETEGGAARDDTRASWSCLLSYNNVLSGIFAVYGPGGRGRLAAPEVQKILSTACLQVSAAIENATLFKKTKLLSITDPVTRLYNHRHFLQVLEAESTRVVRYGTKLSLAMADIDHFKRFNDTYGHKVGDEVLFRVAECMRKAAREIDTVARYGGEEFAVIMPETDLSGALKLAERLRKRIAALRVASPAGPLSVTVSLGVAEADPGIHTSGLVERADEALYAAKHGGRDAVYCRDRSGALARHSPVPGTERHARPARKPR